MKEKLLREYISCLLTDNQPYHRDIRIDSVPCSVEVADTDASRAKGLMGREQLLDGTGMLFVYPHPMQLSFWMKNTLIPLDIAFIDSTGQIVDIAKLIPFNETPVKSPSDCIAALEVPAGWFTKNSISIGSVIS